MPTSSPLVRQKTSGSHHAAERSSPGETQSPTETDGQTMSNTTSDRLFTPNAPTAAILLVSSLGILFLIWLVYIHHAPEALHDRLLFLPPLIALFNGLSAIAIVTGVIFIRRRQIARHRAAMMTAFVFSCLFLVAYLTDHAIHGDILFEGQGVIRILYFVLLASHIFLSMVALPVILITFFFSLTGRFRQHKKIAHFTVPIWLYVSVTGVVIYAMLRHWG